MKNFRLVLLGLIAFVAFACQPERDIPKPQPETEWISRPDGFDGKYTLDQMVVLSRHNIRSPLVSKSSVLTRLTNSNYQWFAWTGSPSTLTAKGERLETIMGGFFKEWLAKKDFRHLLHRLLPSQRLQQGRCFLQNWRQALNNITYAR